MGITNPWCITIFFSQIETHKLEFKEKASSKVGSKDNIDHKAGGGDKKVGIVLISVHRSWCTSVGVITVCVFVYLKLHTVKVFV